MKVENSQECKQKNIILRVHGNAYVARIKYIETYLTQSHAQFEIDPETWREGGKKKKTPLQHK